MKAWCRFWKAFYGICFRRMRKVELQFVSMVIRVWWSAVFWFSLLLRFKMNALSTPGLRICRKQHFCFHDDRPFTLTTISTMASSHRLPVVLLAILASNVASFSIARPKHVYHQTTAARRSTHGSASKMTSTNEDAVLLWTIGAGAVAYFSTYATDGYEPHKL
jgi:hypothetical protein